MESEPAVFYYDLGSPECYLVAERLHGELPVVPEWEPVLGSAGFEMSADPDVASFAERARALGLQPLRWPVGWPPQTRVAMLAATYAKQIGRTIGFSLAAFRQAFAGGRDLADRDTVLLAAAACEMHPAAVLRALELRSVADGLDAAVRRARAAGVTELPALVVGGRVFCGRGALEAVSRTLSGAGA